VSNLLLAKQHSRREKNWTRLCAQAHYEIGMLYYKQGAARNCAEHMQQAEDNKHFERTFTISLSQ
jgi:hypothetical protein